MFEAKVFLAGPSRQESEEKVGEWPSWQPYRFETQLSGVHNVYIADAGLESFLEWHDRLPEPMAAKIRNIVWCGDGDSLGKHASEILKNTASRFEGRWREHFYSTEKDFSDCAAIISLLEYDIRHAETSADRVWLTVHGAFGGRADHELANIFEFAAMLHRLACPATVVLGPFQALTTAPIVMNVIPETHFSLLSAFAHQQLKAKISGARYSGDVLLCQPSHGLSNRAVQSPVVVEPLSPGLPLLVIIIEELTGVTGTF